MAFNVLIVDDSSTMRAVIRKTLKVSGFDIGAFWEAVDGQEAMEVLNREWVDIVLTDINMPNMNGLELMAHMKEDQLLGSIPVVMVTTEGGEKTVRQAIEMGASGYIKKPFLPEDIKRTLNNIMGEAKDEGNNEGGDDAGDF